MSKSTGTSMQGSMRRRIDKGKVRSDCKRCSYRRSSGGTSICTYYDEFTPDRKFCLRYDGAKVKR